MPGAIPDGFIGQGGGMNGAANPALLPETQYARGINVAARGGLVGTRPGLVQLGVTLPQGRFQGAGVWSLASGDRLVYVVDGVVYVLAIETLVNHTLGLLLNATAQCFFTQADKYLIIQDGESSPVYLQDSSGTPGLVPAWSYTSPDDEDVTINAPSLPIGYMGIYAHERVHLVPKYVPNTTEDGRTSIVSGDIKLDNPRTVLEATETEYLNGGGAHALPLEMGFIGGLGVYRNAPTGTGNGDVVVFGRNGVCSFDFGLNRTEEWTAAKLSRPLFVGSGSQSPWSIVNVNDDIVFRSADGLRILRYTVSAVSGASGNLSNVPMSVEVDTFLRSDADYLPYASCAHANNRLLATASGTDTQYFRGLVSWDLAAAYYNGITGVGAFDGLWTGETFAQVVTARKAGILTAFAFTKGPRLYYVDPDASADVSSDYGTRPIQARLHTRAMAFQDPFVVKQLQYVELWLSDLRADTTFTIYYRPNGYPLWQLMGSRTLKVGDGSLPQQRRRVRIAVDFGTRTCDPTTGEPISTASEFEFAIEWTGFAKIKRFRAIAEPIGEEPPKVCSETLGKLLTASAASGDTLDDFSYSIREES